MRKSLEVISLLILAFMAWITWSALAGPQKLPDRIPTHFDAAGNPNGWGTPGMLLLLPVVAVMLYLVLTVASRFPAAFNFPVRVRATVRLQAERITLDMMAWIKAELVLLLALLQSAMIRAAQGGDPRLNPLMVPIAIVLIFMTIGWHMVAVVRLARSASQG